MSGSKKSQDNTVISNDCYALVSDNRVYAPVTRNPSEETLRKHFRKALRLAGLPKAIIANKSIDRGPIVWNGRLVKGAWIDLESPLVI